MSGWELPPLTSTEQAGAEQVKEVDASLAAEAATLTESTGGGGRAPPGGPLLVGEHRPFPHVPLCSTCLGGGHSYEGGSPRINGSFDNFTPIKTKVLLHQQCLDMYCAHLSERRSEPIESKAATEHRTFIHVPGICGICFGVGHSYEGCRSPRINGSFDEVTQIKNARRHQQVLRGYYADLSERRPEPIESKTATETVNETEAAAKSHEAIAAEAEFNGAQGADPVADPVADRVKDDGSDSEWDSAFWDVVELSEPIESKTAGESDEATAAQEAELNGAQGATAIADLYWEGMDYLQDLDGAAGNDWLPQRNPAMPPDHPNTPFPTVHPVPRECETPPSKRGREHSWHIKGGTPPRVNSIFFENPLPEQWFDPFPLLRHDYTIEKKWIPDHGGAITKAHWTDEERELIQLGVDADLPPDCIGYLLTAPGNIAVKLDRSRDRITRIASGMAKANRNAAAKTNANRNAAAKTNAKRNAAAMANPPSDYLHLICD